MAEELLLAANARFYLAFNKRDVEAMNELWASIAPVSCVHPGWDMLLGRDQVVASWLAILASPGAPQVRVENPRAFLHGEMGYVLCREVIDETVLVATNIFVREGGRWCMVHHHSSQSVQARRRRSEDLPESNQSSRDLN